MVNDRALNEAFHFVALFDQPFLMIIGAEKLEQIDGPDAFIPNHHSVPAFWVLHKFERFRVLLSVEIGDRSGCIVRNTLKALADQFEERFRASALDELVELYWTVF